MEKSPNSFFPLFIIAPLLISALSFLKFSQKKRVQFKHLAEFFISLLFMVSSSYYLWPEDNVLVILSVISWMWMLRTFGLICEDLTGIKLFNRVHLYVLAAGGALSFIAMDFDYSLSIIMAPFSVAFSLIGLTFIFQAYQKGPRRGYGYLHHFNFFLILTFFISRLTFATWITDPYLRDHGILTDCYLTILFCVSLFPLYVEITFEKHEKFLENILEARNRQLFSHSGFSEFKILSAGVTHEINNALTVINAKIEQLLRGKERDPEKGLRLIHHSANRIVKSIRSLREFIYNNDIIKVLELKDVVENVLSLYGQRLINHGVAVTTTGLDDKMVMGHRIHLEQVFLSLMNNSVETMEGVDEKWINISCKGQRSYHEITIKDASSPMEDDVEGLLIDPFLSTKEVLDNGIRLVLAKDIIQKHGGTIHYIKSNEYSTFVITLPIEGSIHKNVEFHLEKQLSDLDQLQ